MAANAAASARAEEPARARALSDQGLADYKEGRYAQAIESFMASYAIAPKPVLLYNVAQAYRMQGQCEPALRRYRRYLEEAPDARNRAAAEARIADMERCAQAAPVEPPAPTAEPEAPLPSGDDARRTALPAPDRPLAMTTPPPATAQATVTVKTTTRAKRPLHRRWWLWTSVGAIAAAGVITGAVLGTLRPRFQANLPESGPAAVKGLALAVTF